MERLFVITFLSIRYRARLSTPLCRSFQFFPFPSFLSFFLFFLSPLSCYVCFSPFLPLSFKNPCQPTGNAILQIFFPPPRRFSFRKFQRSGCYWQHGRTDKFSFARSFRGRERAFDRARTVNFLMEVHCGRSDQFDATQEKARARAKFFSPDRSRLSTAGRRKKSCLLF